MQSVSNNQEAVRLLQIAKNYLQNVAVKAGDDPTVISINLEMIDMVQLYLQPNLDFEELQNQINSEK